MLDKSTAYNALAEGMYFFGQKPIKFQIFGLSTACLNSLKLQRFLPRQIKCLSWHFLDSVFAEAGRILY